MQGSCTLFESAAPKGSPSCEHLVCLGADFNNLNEIHDCQIHLWTIPYGTRFAHELITFKHKYHGATSASGSLTSSR